MKSEELEASEVVFQPEPLKRILRDHWFNPLVAAVALVKKTPSVEVTPMFPAVALSVPAKTAPPEDT